MECSLAVIRQELSLYTSKFFLKKKDIKTNKLNFHIEKPDPPLARWMVPAIPATQKMEIRRTVVQSMRAFLKNN
jgi:hypothetical protein